MDGHSLLQRIFSTQGLNPGLLHCRQILYHLSYREVLPTGKTFPRTLLNMRAKMDTIFAKMDTSAEAWGRFNNTYYGATTSPLLTLCMCSGGDFLDLRSNRFAHLISVLAELLPSINFVLGVLGKTKLQFTLLDKVQLLCPGPIYFLPKL